MSKGLTGKEQLSKGTEDEGTQYGGRGGLGKLGSSELEVSPKYF